MPKRAAKAQAASTTGNKRGGAGGSKQKKEASKRTRNAEEPGDEYGQHGEKEQSEPSEQSENEDEDGAGMSTHCSNGGDSSSAAEEEDAGTSNNTNKEEEREDAREVRELCRRALLDANSKKAKRSRPKQRYVWHIIRKEDTLSETNDIFTIFTKKSYDYFVRCQQVRRCKNWGQVQDLGRDVYKEALDKFTGGDYDSDVHDDDGERKPIKFMPRSERLNGYCDFDSRDDNMPTFPPLLFQAMYADAEPWLMKYADNWSSMWGDVDQLHIHAKHKDVILLEIAASGDIAREEPGLGDCMENEMQL